MAIALDATSFGNTGANATSVTWSHTCSGSNRLLVVGVCAPSAVTISSVTYNGVSATYINRSAGTQPVALYYLIAPATGANDIVVTVSSSTFIYCDAVSYTGARQFSQPDASNTTSASDTTRTTAVTTVTDNSWAVLVARGDSTGDTNAGTGSTERVANTGYVQLYDSGSAITPAGSYSMSTTQTSQAVTHAMASFAPGAVYTLTASVGAFTLTGIDSALKTAYKTIASVGSFVLTYKNIISGKGYTMIASVGSFILTGVDAIFSKFSWTNRTKPSTTFTDRTKPSTTFTDRTKPTTNWTKIDKY